MKLPLVTVGTLVLCVPAFHAIAAVFGRPWSLRAAVSIMLVAGARFSLVLLAATPVVWLAVSLGASYDAVKLLAAFAYALGGRSGLPFGQVFESASVVTGHVRGERSRSPRAPQA